MVERGLGLEKREQWEEDGAQEDGTRPCEVPSRGTGRLRTAVAAQALGGIVCVAGSQAEPERRGGSHLGAVQP